MRLSRASCKLRSMTSTNGSLLLLRQSMACAPQSSYHLTSHVAYA